MRIAVYDNLPEGGAKRVVFEQIKYLQKFHQVFYFTNTQKTVFPFELYVKERKTYDLTLPHYRGLLRPFQELFLIQFIRKNKQIANEIEKIQPDVVICHHCQVTQSPLVLAFLKIPTVLYIEEPLRISAEPQLFPMGTTHPIKKSYEVARRKFVAFLDKMALKKATILLANSNFTQRNVLRYYGRPSQTIHPGVDATVFFPSQKPKKLKHFLFIGEKEPINGYDLLAEALKKITKTVPILYVTFKNKQFTYTDADLRDLYQTSFATICLSRNEPFGLTPLESMACATPVIAVQEGGYQETVTRETGILIPRDSSELASALESLYLDSDLRMKRTKSSVKRVTELFNWKNHGQKLEKSLQKAVELQV